MGNKQSNPKKPWFWAAVSRVSCLGLGVFLIFHALTKLDAYGTNSISDERLTIIICWGLLMLALGFIDQIQEFSFFNLSIKLKARISEAEHLIDNLKKLTKLTGRLALEQIWDQVWIAENHKNLFESISKIADELDFSEEDILEIFGSYYQLTWRRLLNMAYDKIKENAPNRSEKDQIELDRLEKKFAIILAEPNHQIGLQKFIDLVKSISLITEDQRENLLTQEIQALSFFLEHKQLPHDMWDISQPNRNVGK